MQCRFLLNVVVREGSAVFELLSGENQSLLVRWDAFLILDLRLDVINGIGRFNFEGDGLAGKSLDKDLHTTTEAENEMESGFLLNVIVGECAAVFELLASKDQALLVRGDAFLVLDLRLNIVDGIRRFDLQCDGLAGEGLDKDLHTATKTENKVEGGLLLDVIIGKSATVLKLLAGEDQALLIRRNSLLVLNLGLDIVDSIGGLDLKSDGLASDCKDVSMLRG